MTDWAEKVRTSQVVRSPLLPGEFMPLPHLQFLFTCWKATIPPAKNGMECQENSHLWILI